jgi:RNA polymerase sigma-70 factor (ECF subfamily)
MQELTSSAHEVDLRQRLLAGLAGDAAAYHRFLSELARFLRGFLRRRMMGFPDDVEDLVQETMLAVHNQRRTYDPQQPLLAWLRAIARYKLVDHLRRHARGDALNEPLDDVADVLTAADDGEVVDALGAVPYTAMAQSTMVRRTSGSSRSISPGGV